MKTGQPHKTHPHSEHRQHSHPSVRIWGNEHAHGIEWAQGGGVAEGGGTAARVFEFIKGSSRKTGHRSVRKKDRHREREGGREEGAQQRWQSLAQV